MTNAVIYVRVSTDEQAKNFSLGLQEKECRAHCERNGWQVVDIFRDEGESAKSADRPELQRMIRFCEANRKKNPIDFVLVYRIDRFARNEHQAIRALLTRWGVQLRSVTEPIDETAQGQFMEDIYAAAAKYDNLLRSERTTSGMREAALRGRWQWLAPLGYAKDVASKSSLVVDQERAPLIRLAFERMATGRLSQAEVLEEVTSLGLRTLRGKALSKQRFSAMLSNPLYAGRIVVSSLGGVDAKGDFESLITPDVFEVVQEVLTGRRPAKPSRTLDNPEFPLRRIVLCGKCRSPITGSFSTGRNGTRHPYYKCPRKGCRGDNVRRDVFHQEFESLLASHIVKPQVMDLFVAVVEEAWSDRERASREQRQRFEDKLEELGAEEEALVRAYTLRDSLTDDSYRRQSSRIEEQMRLVRDQVDNTASIGIDLAETLEFARILIGDLPSVWNRLAAKQKPQFARALYPSGLVFNERAIETVESPWLLTVFPVVPDDLSAIDLNPVGGSTSYESRV